MSTSPLPAKQDIPKEIWREATSLSDEAQNAATRKARELGFDLTKGRIPLEETFLNLSQNRNVLVDAVEKNKIVQLPLKLQYTLLGHTQKVAEALRGLTNGADTLLSLEDGVEDLTAIIWQYNLHNLSDRVLGFQNKMNQLKEQEVLIRRVHREAEDFGASGIRARGLLGQLEEIARAGVEQSQLLQTSHENATAALARITEQEQKIAGLVIQSEQQDSAAAQHAANARASAADVETIAGRTRSLQPEIEATRTALDELTKSATQLISSTEERITNSLSEVRDNYEQLQADAKAQLLTIREQTTASSAKFVDESRSKIDDDLARVRQESSDTQQKIDTLALETSSNIANAEAKHEARLTNGLAQFEEKGDAAIAEFSSTYAAKFTEVTAHSESVINKSDLELQRLTTELNSLEGRIRESIERATGFTLFHSFQKRQLDLAQSKRFWGIALAVAVGVSLIASGVFIYSLRFVQVYNAAFYLKLSISIPLIYAIAFCNVQYSRERRLEEEYAFKSNISISLEPYQKVVEKFIDQQKPEERLKYATFIIDSINRVFTSPTEIVFEDHAKDRNSAEKVIKAVGDIIDPLAKALRK